MIVKKKIKYIFFSCNISRDPIRDRTREETNHFHTRNGNSEPRREFTTTSCYENANNKGDKRRCKDDA